MGRYDELRDKILPVLLPYAERIAVFGSYARGEETPDSDIDLLVRLKSRDKRAPIGWEWFTLDEELSEIIGRKVDLVTDEDLSPYIRPYVEKDLMILYEE